MISYVKELFSGGDYPIDGFIVDTPNYKILGTNACYDDKYMHHPVVVWIPELAWRELFPDRGMPCCPNCKRSSKVVSNGYNEALNIYMHDEIGKLLVRRYICNGCPPKDKPNLDILSDIATSLYHEAKTWRFA